MPTVGDQFTISLKQAHLEWGTHRHTNTRGNVYGEGYIHIPSKYARNYNITNSNHPTANNLYSCSSTDGGLNQVQLKACGCVKRKGINAKQFQGNGNLQVIGQWYAQVNAKIGDEIQVVFTSPTSLTLTHKAIP